MGDGNDVMSNNAWVQAGRPLFQGVAFVISHEHERGYTREWSSNLKRASIAIFSSVAIK